MAAVAAFCGLAFTLGGCSSEPSAGSLTYPNDGTYMCGDAAYYRDLAVGIPLDFKSGSPITITKVDASGGEGLKLVKAYVMPVDENQRLATDQFPLSAKFNVDWAEAKAATGATLEAKTHRDLVLHVRRETAQGGDLTSVNVSYEQDGHTFTVDTYTKIGIRRTC